MKLLTKTSIHYLWASIVLLVVFGALLFYLQKKEVSAEIREQLELQTTLVKIEMEKGQLINYPFVKIEKSDANTTPWFRDTAFVDPVQAVVEEYYVLTSHQKINNQGYAVTVITAYIGWDEYFKTIGITFFGLSLLLVLAAVGINYLISKQIWKPFLLNLTHLKNYSSAANEELVLQNSNIDEFVQLNTVLIDFAERAKQEYHILQEFTENTSHELQTPISIIRARLESLGQIELDHNGKRFLNDAKNAVERLNKVNKALVLLTKLKGGQFPDVKTVDIKEPLLRQAEQLHDFFENRGLSININAANCPVKASPHLIDVLLTNLLSNQLKHAPKNSSVSIHLGNSELRFTNEGPALPFAESQLFKRFVKGNQDNAGIGLGLAIVFQICKMHGWAIAYNYTSNQHNFIINFRQSAY